ncbi:uncharacterized protein LOC144868173, partial [Branchiostoma floridae x Branchiostoma japonicum]
MNEMRGWPPCGGDRLTRPPLRKTPWSSMVLTRRPLHKLKGTPYARLRQSSRRTSNSEVSLTLQKADDAYRKEQEARKNLKQQVHQASEDTQGRRISTLETEVSEDTNKKQQETRKNLEQQVHQASEPQDILEREVILHAADARVSELTTVKEQLEDRFDNKLSAAQEEAIKEELRLAKISWEEQKRIQEQSISVLEEKIKQLTCDNIAQAYQKTRQDAAILSIQTRCEELEKQNNLLHEQLEKLSNQMLSLQMRNDASPHGAEPGQANTTNSTTVSQ